MPEIQLTEKEAQELALKIEANDDKAKKVKRFLKKTKPKKTKKSPKTKPAKATIAPDASQDDEAWVAQKQKEAIHTVGDNLKCTICRKTFNELWCDTCYTCFKNWMLSCKPKKEKEE